MSDLFDPNWKPGENTQSQTGQQTKNNIPIVQKPINFEMPKIPDIDFKGIASNIPTVQAAQNIVNAGKNAINYFSKEEIAKRQLAEQQAKAQAELELKKQEELQASLQKSATDALKNTEAFSNVSSNVSTANIEGSKVANSDVGTKNVTAAQTAVDSKMEADQNLIDDAYVRDLANQNAIAQTKNESLKIINDSYNTIQESFAKLGASADKSILDSERQLAETMRRREENRQQTIDNQLQWQNEVARLSGYGLSDNMSVFIAGKMMNFIGKYDSDTFDIFEKGQKLTSNLREERKNLNNSVYTLVSNYVKQKDELFLQAKQAENMAKYMVDGKSDYINSLKQDIIIKAKEKNIELQQKLYKDIDDRLTIANKTLTSEVNRVEQEKKVAEVAIQNAIADGSIAHWTPEQKQKYASMVGTTPSAIENNRKASIAQVMAKLATSGNKDLSIIDGMTDLVMKLTNSGVNLQDAIRQVAEQNGLSNEFNKLMYNPQAFNLDGVTQITQDFTDQASAQNFANTLKDKYDDIKVVEKNGKWTITGKEKGTGKELNLEQLITGSGLKSEDISGLQSKTIPTSTQGTPEVLEGTSNGTNNNEDTNKDVSNNSVRNFGNSIQIKTDFQTDLPTDLPTNTSDSITNSQNKFQNQLNEATNKQNLAKNKANTKLISVIDTIQKQIPNIKKQKEQEGISAERIKSILDNEILTLFDKEFKKQFGFGGYFDMGNGEYEVSRPKGVSSNVNSINSEIGELFYGLEVSDLNRNGFKGNSGLDDFELNSDDIRKMFNY